MTVAQEIATKRTRESTSKVRSGCSTCKARRVKCDESKPICRRCAIGGRNCEYNVAPSASVRNVITVYVAPTQRQTVLFRNDCGLDFFHYNLAAKLDGQFESKFWSKLVLQLSHSEPSIRHAISAISIIHQDINLSLQHPTGYVKANSETHREWNAAIKTLSSRIKTYPDSNLVPLTCCLLFTCIELLRGNPKASMVHIENGLHILAGIHRNTDPVTKLVPSLSSNDLEIINDQIVPVFSRLNVLCSLHGRTFPPAHALTAKEDGPHRDLAHASQQLYVITNTCVRFMGPVSEKAIIFETDLDDFIKQAKLQTRLDTWYDQLQDLLQRMRTAGISPKSDTLNLLLVHYKVIYIWLRVCTIAGEMTTDNYHTDFEELVEYAEQVTRSGDDTATPLPLSFDIRTLAPLYYATLKCRHPTIRRRALELLPLAARREGVWNAHHAYATAKRVIELEESHLNDEGLPEETSRIYGLPLPDDESRVDDRGEIPAIFRKFDGSIVPSPNCPGTLMIEFMRKPWGLLGEWETTTEYIKI